MDETRISGDSTQKTCEKSYNLLLQYACSECGQIFSIESECDKHVTNCVHPIRTGNPLDVSSSSTKSHIPVLVDSGDSIESVKNTVSYDTFDNKINDNFNLKQELKNVMLEIPTYSATSQMISDNEMLITLPYAELNESIVGPLDYSNEIAICYEEYTTQPNNSQIKCKTPTFNESTEHTELNKSDSVIIDNLDVEDFNNIEQDGTFKILSMYVTKPPSPSTGNVQKSHKNNIAGTNQMADLEMQLINIPRLTDIGKQNSSSQIGKDRSDDGGKNVKSSETENTIFVNKEKCKRKIVSVPKSQRYNLKVHMNKNKRKKYSSRKIKDKNIITKEELLKSEQFINSLKAKVASRVKSNQNTPNNDNQLQSKMYKKIKVKKEPKDPKNISVYEFYDEEEEKYKKKLKEDQEETRELKARICKFCHEIFDDPIDVLRHKREKHRFNKINMSRQELEPYLKLENQKECPLCFKEISVKGHKSVYLRHLATHCDQYEFECRLCGMQFRRKDHWINHESRHIVPPPKD